MGSICDPVQYQHNYARPVYGGGPYNQDAYGPHHYRPSPPHYHNNHHNHHNHGFPHHHGHHMSPHSHNHYNPTRPTGGMPFNTDASMNTSNRTRRNNHKQLSNWLVNSDICMESVYSSPLFHTYQYSLMEPIVPEASSNPAVDELHEYVSRLDFYKDLKETEQSIKRNIEYDDVDIPTLEKQDSAINVPLKFLTESSYTDVWRKLFLYEARGQILKAKLQESCDPEKVEIVSVQQVKPFRFFTFKRLNPSAKTNYPFGSLVMISPDEIINDKPVDHLLGFIDSNEEIRVKLVFDQALQKKHPERWDRFDSTKEWNIKLLCGIVTIEREFKALQNFPKLDPILKKTILNPLEFVHCLEDKFHIPEQLDKKLKQIYNEFQYKAIHQCLKKEGVTLVQGPPGTGKTRTVLGTLSVLTNSFNIVPENSSQITHREQKHDQNKRLKANPWFANDYVDWRDQVFLELPIDLKKFDATKKYLKSTETDHQLILKKREQNIMLPGKILICGPSNAAVDQIIRKILQQGLLDNMGKKFKPQIVRVGDNYDKNLENVSLDYLANVELVRNPKQDINFYRNKILRNCKIVCGTLSSAGHQFLENAELQFDTVVIDEACQAVEVSMLIPLCYGCKRLILIGDPNQLPSTVFSRLCIKQGYDQSLFERMMKCGYPVNVLKTQYRMHPDISSIIGNTFYGGVLLDSPTVSQEHFYKAFSPFMFLHIPKSSQVKARRSFKNIVQGKPIKLLASFLQQIGCNDIGILSPYSQQIKYLEDQKFSKACEIKTIDSFQGRQKSAIIFNTVRAGLKGEPRRVKKNKKKTIGFLSDRRRINVGLSRAKHLCIVVGDANWLHKFDIWHQIIEQALQKHQVYEFKQDVKDYFKLMTQNKNMFLKTKIDHV